MIGYTVFNKIKIIQKNKKILYIGASKFRRTYYVQEPNEYGLNKKYQLLRGYLVANRLQCNIKIYNQQLELQLFGKKDTEYAWTGYRYIDILGGI